MRPRTVSLLIASLISAAFGILGLVLVVQGISGNCCTNSGVLARPLLVLVGAVALIAAVALALRIYSTARPPN